MNQLAHTANRPPVVVIKRQDALFLLADLSALLVLYYWLLTWLDLGRAVGELVVAALSLLTYRLDLWLTLAGVVGKAVLWAVT